MDSWSFGQPLVWMPVYNQNRNLCNIPVQYVCQNHYSVPEYQVSVEHCLEPFSEMVEYTILEYEGQRTGPRKLKKKLKKASPRNSKLKVIDLSNNELVPKPKRKKKTNPYKSENGYLVEEPETD